MQFEKPIIWNLFAGYNIIRMGAGKTGVICKDKSHFGDWVEGLWVGGMHIPWKMDEFYLRRLKLDRNLIWRVQSECMLVFVGKEIFWRVANTLAFN